MGTSAEELTNEIADTRSALASDLDQLQDKVSPAAIVDRKKAAARRRVGGVRDKVMGGAQDATSAAGSAGSSAGDAVSGAVDGAVTGAQDRYDGAPLAAGVAAFGLGMVVAAMFPATRAEARAAAQLTDVVKEQAQPLVEDAKAAASDVGQSLKDSAGTAAEEIRQTSQDAASRVQDEGAGSAQNVRSETQA